MASFINKLLGKDDEAKSHSHSGDVKHENDTYSTSTTGGDNQTYSSASKTVHTSAGGNDIEGRTVQHEGVNIKSTISSDATSTVSMANQQKLTDLVSKLGSTHSQIDQYAKAQTDKINDEIQGEINQVLARTRRQQDELLLKANEHTAQIDADYRAKLQKTVEEIDATKAKRIADIEKDLNKQQADILQSARNDIDKLNKKAANLKIGALQDAQARAAADANAITAEAAHLSHASTLHQSSGTTTVKTEVSAAATATDVGGATKTTTFNEAHTSTSGGGANRTVETSKTQSHGRT